MTKTRRRTSTVPGSFSVSHPMKSEDVCPTVRGRGPRSPYGELVAIAMGLSVGTSVLVTIPKTETDTNKFRNRIAAAIRSRASGLNGGKGKPFAFSTSEDGLHIIVSAI